MRLTRISGHTIDAQNGFMKISNYSSRQDSGVRIQIGLRIGLHKSSNLVAGILILSPEF